MSLLSSQQEIGKLKFETLIIPCTIQTNTVAASVKGFSRFNQANIFSKTDGQTITAYDAAPGFTVSDLADAATPAIFGLIVSPGGVSGGGLLSDVSEIISIEVPVSSILATTVTCSAVVWTGKGVGSTGVTASGNISGLLSFTGTAGGTTGSVNFSLVIRYLKRQP